MLNKIIILISIFYTIYIYMSKSNGYTNLNREHCEEYLDAAAWALDILNQELLEKNIVNSENIKYI